MSYDGCCESVRAESLMRIYHYLDGELTTTEIREISIHLEQCPSCHDEYEIEALLKELVRRSCSHDQAPMGLREKIRQRIALEQNS
ncbi:MULTISPECIES: mycothiol system anti-sigma-R factor [unclassified Brevibacterium]|uniref:mycothiol system anti-sigma-R factor n=1 Tax=unclassified Brevibacterium TaxID=2614124 RepID=UPI001092E0F1|nr:mycothiol system anti-sigma-R factor [Brevibacterium sp. S22]TGD32989.1 mycothiol system anti-sigma-R factor [Brevibacterium sp. S22]